MSVARCTRDARCGDDAGHAGPCRTLTRRYVDALIKLGRKVMTRLGAGVQSAPKGEAK